MLLDRVTIRVSTPITATSLPPEPRIRTWQEEWFCFELHLRWFVGRLDWLLLKLSQRRSRGYWWTWLEVKSVTCLHISSIYSTVCVYLLGNLGLGMSLLIRSDASQLHKDSACSGTSWLQEAWARLWWAVSQYLGSERGHLDDVKAASSAAIEAQEGCYDILQYSHIIKKGRQHLNSMHSPLS